MYVVLGKLIFTPDPIPGSLDPGSILIWTAEQFRRIETALKSLGSIQGYKPVFSSAGGGAAVGNGSLLGWYLAINDFMWVTVDFSLGTTSTPGTGAWLFTVPGGIRATQKGAGSVKMRDQSATQDYSGCCNVGANVLTVAGPTAQVDATNPFVWAASDRLQLTICFPAR